MNTSERKSASRDRGRRSAEASTPLGGARTWIPGATLVWTGLALASLATTACTFVLTDFTVISTKSENATLRLGTRVSGESCSYFVLGAIPLSGDPQASLKQAIDQVLARENAVFLVDGAASEQITGVPGLFHRRCYVVEGTTANPIPP